MPAHDPPADATVAVSVVVPIYNTEAYLRRCLDSILGQSMADLEILCVDDGSTDGSADILAEYARADARVRPIRQRAGASGPGAARNTAIRQAKGTYLGFVDSDDFAHRDMFQRLYKVAKDSDSDVAFCTIKKFNDQAPNERYPRCVFDKHVPPHLDDRVFTWRDISEVLFRLRFAAWNKIYKRSFVSRWKIEFSEGIFFEDLMFSHRAMLLAERMRFVRSPLYYNRKERQGATTFEQGARVFDAITAMEQFESFLQDRADLVTLFPQFEAFRYNKLYGYLYKNDGAHIAQFYKHLRLQAASPALDGNPFLYREAASKLPLIREKELLDFLAHELWVAKTTNASLTRQNADLRRKSQHPLRRLLRRGRTLAIRGKRLLSSPA